MSVWDVADDARRRARREGRRARRREPLLPPAAPPAAMAVQPVRHGARAHARRGRGQGRSRSRRCSATPRARTTCCTRTRILKKTGLRIALKLNESTMFRLSQYHAGNARSHAARGPARAPSGPVVIWNLIRRCNLTCKHCYSISADVDFPGELSTPRSSRVMDDLKAFGVPVLILSGGEPLLRPRYLRDLAARQGDGLLCRPVEQRHADRRAMRRSHRRRSASTTSASASTASARRTTASAARRAPSTRRSPGFGCCAIAASRSACASR